jgi:hypothetical protein
MSARRLPRDEKLQLALSRQQAADALGISLRHFQRHVQPHLRCVYSGHLRLYPVRELERWLAENEGPTPQQRRSAA